MTFKGWHLAVALIVAYAIGYWFPQPGNLIMLSKLKARG